MDDLAFVLIVGAVVVGIPFILPIVAWVSSRNTRARIAALEDLVFRQQKDLATLQEQVSQVRREAAGPPPATPPPKPAPVPAPATPSGPPAPPAAPKPPVVPPPTPVHPTPPLPPASAARPAPVVQSPPVVPQSRRPPPPPPAVAEKPTFDWESLVGVKLFSAIAGIALVIAAVSFLRYSIEHGWIEPPVRVAIGIMAAIALLVACELKAARKYPVTANALDAAAIAILFATFFAAHALWGLLGSFTTFGLLALVTAVAVLLSIRRDSLFIAVLGLLGGFATPVLLSTGENQPIPLFAYLLLLNIGLAWVAHQKRWAVLSLLTVVLTTLYQWGWVFKFLSVSHVPLAMGIFLIFPVAAFAMRMFHRRAVPHRDEAFDRSATLAAVLPLLFAIYLAAVPEYGAMAGLLFGFLFLLDAGLFAIAVGRRQELLHAVGGVATLLVFAVHRVHHPAPLPQILLFTSLFVVFFLAAPIIAARAGRDFSEMGERAAYVAPLLLFAPASLAVTPAAASPLPLFAVLFGLVGFIAWRALASGWGGMYFIAIFLAVAAQALWSTQHLTTERLGSAIALYAAFGVLQFAVPLIARRWYEQLTPETGGGVTLLASLLLLLFLAGGSVAPVALWGLALLLAILNAALFVESAAGELPALTIAGGVVSWIVLAVWWYRAAASVGILPSLLVMTGLALIMMAGHAWAHARASRPRADGDVRFAHGLYLGLVGHLFLCFVALDRAWSIPPWPLFGTLGVLTLAVSTTALSTRAPILHAAAVTAAGLVLLLWSAVAGSAPWPTTALVAGAALAAYGLAWIRPFPARAADTAARARRESAAAALIALCLSEALSMVAGSHGADAPRVQWLAIAHAVTLSLLLAVTWIDHWHAMAVATALPAAGALIAWRAAHAGTEWWDELLEFAAVLYAVLMAYPFALGRRARGAREPYILAVLSSAIFFFAARDAFIAGDLRFAIGVVPVAEGLVMALLLRQLLGIEPAGKRDLGRLALVAGTALAFVTVAIPLQLKNQWITIGWAFEGAALAWLFTRIPHRGLLYAASALLATGFARLALNPAVFRYEPRGSMRVLNWYLYAYVLCAAAMLTAAWWFSKTDDRLGSDRLRPRQLLPAGAAILLFEVLNIEIADFYATGPEITFRFGATLAQDLTYTIGWLGFGMMLLAAGIAFRSHAARVAAVVLIAVTTFKCFLYDLSSLGGLYRVASFVGLGISLALVSIALQKFVLSRPQEKTP